MSRHEREGMNGREQNSVEAFKRGIKGSRHERRKKIKERNAE